MSNKQLSLPSVVVTAALTALVTSLISEWTPQLINRIYTQLTQQSHIVVTVKRKREPVSGVNFSVSSLDGMKSLDSGVTDKLGIVVLKEIDKGTVVLEGILREGFYERIYANPHEVNSLPFSLSLEIDEHFSDPRLSGRLYPPEPIYPKCNSAVLRPKANYFFLFRWTPIPEAETYTVEIDCLGCEHTDDWFSRAGTTWHIRENLGIHTKAAPIYSTMFYQGVEDRKFRWRVWAVGSEGKEGEKSPWCEFSFSDV